MTAPTPITSALLAEHPLPAVADVSDKGGRGSVLVVGGSPGLTGGVLLAGLAALRAGAGRLQLATEPSAGDALGVAVPEAGILPADPDALDAPLRQASAILLGPGTLEASDIAEVVEGARQAISEGDGRLVVDAAALEAWAQIDDRAGNERTVLVPNLAEAADLLDRSVEDVEADLEGTLGALVDRHGATVAVRGETTVVGGPDGCVFVEDGGSVGLATSGSGDVLAGLVAGYLARGADPSTATIWAVHVHAEAGRRCASEIGTVGFLARELLDALAVVQRGLPGWLGPA